MRIHRIWWLGVLCSLFIAFMGMASRDVYQPNMSLYKLTKYGLAVFIMLLIIWCVNLGVYLYFKQRKPVAALVKVSVIFLADLALISLFIALKRSGFLASIQDYFLRDTQVFARLCLATLWTTSIQFSFIYAIQQEVFKRHNEQLRNANLVAELEGLKQQINPHFLFNSLGTLRVMVHDKDEHSEEFVLRLAAVYRQLLTKRNETTMTLQEELTFLESYLFMLRFRYEDGLHISIELNPTNRTERLPAFCLQLLVENCIKHNVVSAKMPLAVRIYQPNSTSITVQNTKQLKQTKEEATGIGLTNLQKRYTLLGLTDAVTIIETASTFTVSIKLISE